LGYSPTAAQAEEPTVTNRLDNCWFVTKLQTLIAAYWVFGEGAHEMLIPI